jgi:hypothetical protein
MSFYGELADTATELLVEFGQSMTLRRKTVGAYNSASGSAAVTTTDVTVQGVVFDEPMKDDSGTMVNVVSKKVILSVWQTVPPNVDDTLIILGQKYTVKSVQVVAPNGTNVVYKCYVG